MSGGGMIGLGKSEQQSQNQSLATSNSSSYGSSDQTVFNSGMYTNLMQGASGAATSAINSSDLTTAARQLFTGGSDLLTGLMNGNSNAGTDYLKSSFGDNSAADAQVNQLREDTGRLFTDQFNPAITADAVSGGNLGGGRQGVAQGMAMDSLARNFTSGAVQIRAADQSRKDAAATTVAGNSLAAASTGLGALPSLLSLVQTGQNNGLDIYSRLAQIFGGPTTLTNSKSGSVAQSLANSFGSGEGHAWNFQAAGQGGV